MKQFSAGSEQSAAPPTRAAHGRRLHAVAQSAGAVLGNGLLQRKLEEPVVLQVKQSAEVLRSAPGSWLSPGQGVCDVKPPNSRL